MNFSASQLAKFFDHTVLKADATVAQIQKICDEAKTLGTATVCVNPIWVEFAAKLLAGSGVLPITVIGFPLGASTGETKVFEARDAINKGAREIDMVIAAGAWNSGQRDEVRREINDVHRACAGTPLKVIFETSLLDTDSISTLARWCAEDRIEFVKTSTGFGSRGASTDDVRRMKAAIESVPNAVTKIKASGGISTLAAVTALIAAGAERIGASATVSIINELGGAQPKNSSPY